MDTKMFFERKLPYIVAELNSSHRGKIENAIKMIDAAKECGCDAVKFQSWSADSLYCKTYYDQNPIAKRMVKGFAIKPDDLKMLSEYCKKIEIGFSSTPYSFEEVDFLVDECRADFIKVASMDINNSYFLKYIAEKKQPIVLSTGMATIEEIRQAVKIIEEAGNKDICILHCVSIYPVDAKNVNLRNILMLKEEFPQYLVGYSDHTIGCFAACAAVGMGAALIEKHFTLDNSVIGWDNQMATEPEEMRKLVESCRLAYDAMGSFERVVSEEEILQRNKMRRSIVAARDIEEGKIIELGDLNAKRPGGYISVANIDDIVGKKAIKHIGCDELISIEDIEE